MTNLTPLQSRINELNSAIVNYADDKIYTTGFYNALQLTTHLEQNKKNWSSNGLYDKEVVSFDRIKTNALFIIQIDGIEQSKYQFEKVYKKVVKYQNQPNSITITIRKNLYSDQYQIITEQNVFNFFSRNELEEFLQSEFKEEIFLRDREKMNFVTIDFETANSYRGSICSIGLAKYRDGKLFETRETLINPNDDFDCYNIEIHGITKDMVADAPTFKDYFPTLKSFIENEVVVAHFASFDMSVLRHACNDNSIDYPNFQHTCTYQIAKKIWPGLINYKLKTLAQKFEYTFKHHNALEDAKASGHILIKAFEEVNSSTFDELLKAANLTIGKHHPGGYKPSETKSQYSPVEITTSNTEFDKSHPFFEKTVIFTGTLKSMVRRDAAQKVVGLGGHFSNTVNTKTSYLVVGDQDLSKFNGGTKSSKMKKAEQLLAAGQEIEIVGEQEFLMMV